MIPERRGWGGRRKSTSLYTFSKVAMLGAKVAPLINMNKRVAQW
jgi:hypothetical protein